MTLANETPSQTPSGHPANEQQLSREEARTLCDSLVELTGEMISMLDQETRLLQNASMQDFSALNIRKQALSLRLANELARFQQNADFVRHSARDKLEILAEQQGQFQKSLETNHQALTAMMAVSERLINVVADKVSRKESGAEVYTAAGQLGVSGNKTNAPISVNTVL